MSKSTIELPQMPAVPSSPDSGKPAVVGSTVYLMDCVAGMKEYPEKWFDLAVVDPPYGIDGTDEIGFGDKKSGRVNRPSKWGEKKWDKQRPTLEYFTELFRVSKNQIISGGNYFSDLLPATRCWLVWDKVQRIDQADAELFWTSFTSSVRIYSYSCSKLQGFMNPDRFHPTEKPISLYEWIYKNYAKKEFKILDTHLGSQSSRIAADKAGLDFTGFEIDKEYYDLGEKRFKQYKAQIRIEGW